jgi:hypothetical protein
MSDELRTEANGFDRRVKSFNVYDVNGYRFRTRGSEAKRGNLKTTCSGVHTPGSDGKDYYVPPQVVEEAVLGGRRPR